ncbi:MAG: hypothetical protein Q8O29_10295 [Polaromonas sp.]|nr:hypothetical protein [Polaromonas sp.]MDP2818642.1 hypothetical protein [Polaromonas sp.]
MAVIIAAMKTAKAKVAHVARHGLHVDVRTLGRLRGLGLFDISGVLGS